MNRSVIPLAGLVIVGLSTMAWAVPTKAASGGAQDEKGIWKEYLDTLSAKYGLTDASGSSGLGLGEKDGLLHVRLGPGKKITLKVPEARTEEEIDNALVKFLVTGFLPGSSKRGISHISPVLQEHKIANGPTIYIPAGYTFATTDGDELRIFGPAGTLGLNPSEHKISRLDSKPGEAALLYTGETKRIFVSQYHQTPGTYGLYYDGLYVDDAKKVRLYQAGLLGEGAKTSPAIPLFGRSLNPYKDVAELLARQRTRGVKRQKIGGRSDPLRAAAGAFGEGRLTREEFNSIFDRMRLGRGDAAPDAEGVSATPAGGRPGAVNPVPEARPASIRLDEVPGLVAPALSAGLAEAPPRVAGNILAGRSASPLAVREAITSGGAAAETPADSAGCQTPGDVFRSAPERARHHAIRAAMKKKASNSALRREFLAARNRCIETAEKDRLAAVARVKSEKFDIINYTPETFTQYKNEQIGSDGKGGALGEKHKQDVQACKNKKPADLVDKPEMAELLRRQDEPGALARKAAESNPDVLRLFKAEVRKGVDRLQADYNKSSVLHGSRLPGLAKELGLAKGQEGQLVVSLDGKTRLIDGYFEAEWSGAKGDQKISYCAETNLGFKGIDEAGLAGELGRAKGAKAGRLSDKEATPENINKHCGVSAGLVQFIRGKLAKGPPAPSAASPAPQAPAPAAPAPSGIGDDYLPEKR